jgi:GDPmannose 4,6-dehydratase
LQDKLKLGNLDAERDWGYAGDFVRAMWMMLQQNEPDDYVVATGKKHTVRDLVTLAFNHAGLDSRRHVETDPSLLRPADVSQLCGDYGKAQKRLGWEPTVSFPELIAMMVDADLARVRQEIGGSAR